MAGAQLFRSKWLSFRTLLTAEEPVCAETFTFSLRKEKLRLDEVRRLGIAAEDKGQLVTENCRSMRRAK